MTLIVAPKPLAWELKCDGRGLMAIVAPSNDAAIAEYVRRFGGKTKRMTVEPLRPFTIDVEVDNGLHRAVCPACGRKSQQHSLRELAVISFLSAHINCPMVTT